MVRLVDPGPTIFRVISRISSPLVRVRVPLVLNMIVSPAVASARICRSEPGPASDREVTVFVAAEVGTVNRHRSRSTALAYLDPMVGGARSNRDLPKMECLGLTMG